MLVFIGIGTVHEIIGQSDDAIAPVSRLGILSIVSEVAQHGGKFRSIPHGIPANHDLWVVYGIYHGEIIIRHIGSRRQWCLIDHDLVFGCCNAGVVSPIQSSQT